MQLIRQDPAFAITSNNEDIELNQKKMLSFQQTEIDAKHQTNKDSPHVPKLSQTCTNIHLQKGKKKETGMFFLWNVLADLVLRAIHGNIIAGCWLWWSSSKSEPLRRYTWSRG